MVTLEDAKKLARCGLCVLPTHFGEKSPDVPSWTPYQNARPSMKQIEKWFTGNHRDGLGIVCGKVSGGLEVLDFDKKGQEFEPWKESIPESLYSRLVVEKTVSGGYHVYYRCELVSGWEKPAREDNGSVLIESRGELCFIKCAPSDGYVLEQGDLSSIPTISIDERETLITAARCRNKYKEPLEKYTPPSKSDRTAAASTDSLRPGDDYNQRGDFREYLLSLGWKPSGGVRADGNQHWTRPGKQKGTSATLKEFGGIQVLYNFSANAGVNERVGLSLFKFRTITEFGGDYRACAKVLAKEGYGVQKKEYKVENIKSIPVNSTENFNLNLSQITNPNVRDPDNFNDFPLNKLPDCILNFVLDQARAKNQNPANIAALLLSLIGGVIGASVRLKLDESGWLVAPILWTCIIGVSGQGKSPMIDAVRSLLDDKSDELYEQYERAQKKYEEDYSDWCKQRKKGNPTPAPVPAQQRKLYVTDTTFEGIAKDIKVSNCRTLFILDEFGSFFSMLNRTKTPGEASKWLSGYNGGAIVTSRANAKEVRIKQAYWGMLGGTTPEKFRQLIVADGGDKDGTLSRMCLVWTPRVKEFIRYKENEEVKKHRDDLKKAIETLIDFAPGEDIDAPADEYGNRPLLQYTELKVPDEIIEEWQDMREENSAIVSDPSNSTDAVAGFLSKSLELTPRIAIILHCIEAAYEWQQRPPRPETRPSPQNGLPVTVYVKDDFALPKKISKQVWHCARTIADWFTTESLICYELLHFTDTKSEDVKSNEILTAIANSKDGMTARDIYRKLRRYRTREGKKELVEILNNLISKGLIRVENGKSANGAAILLYKVC